MADIICATGNITSEACPDRGGIRLGYYAEYDDIDWEAMAADDTKFDPVNQVILEYVMKPGKTFKVLEFEQEQSFYEFTYTEDTQLYELLVTLIFQGKSVERRNVINAVNQCCNLYVHLFDYLGKQRSVGVDWTGNVFSKIPKRLRVGRHLDASGQLTQSKARDEIDFTGRSFYTPLLANVDEATIPTDAVASGLEAYGPTEGGTEVYGPTEGGTEAYGPVSS